MRTFYFFILSTIFLASSCKKHEVEPSQKTLKIENPVGFFEIPVLDLDKSIAFYSAVFGFDFTKQNIDGNEMAFFPSNEKATGIGGALAKGKSYKPSKTGTLIYFSTKNIDKTLIAIQKNGGKILYAKTSIGELGFVAEFEDNSGNKIALHQDK